MLDSLKRGIIQLASRKIYITMMLIVPIAFSLFFIDLMNEGLPLNVPVGMVDMDHSSMSRRIARSLNAMELIDITDDVESCVAASFTGSSTSLPIFRRRL